MEEIDLDNLGYLTPFYHVVHGPLRVDNTLDGQPGRERFVPLHFVAGMTIPPGGLLRGDFIVPEGLSGPAPVSQSAGLLPVLRQGGAAPEAGEERLRGDGGVVTQSAQVEQFQVRDRLRDQGEFVTF